MLNKGKSMALNIFRQALLQFLKASLQFSNPTLLSLLLWHQIKAARSLVLQPELSVAKEAFISSVYQWKHFSTRPLFINTGH